VSASSLSTLWNWFSPIQFGAQTGLSSGLTDALGGGLARASFRFTLWDGDSAAGDTGHGTQTLRVNGVEIGNWSDVDAQQTDSVGDAGAGGFSGGGFRSDTLDTGWFDVTDSALLTPLFAAMDAADSLAFVFVDTSSIDNYLDFTVGLDVLPLNAALPPTLVTPPPAVPLPGTGALTALALLGALGAGRRRR
jgi:MYXO-CTERM domain-containing protein